MLHVVSHRSGATWEESRCLENHALGFTLVRVRISAKKHGVRGCKILTDIKHDINVLFVFKVSIEADNILMIQRSVNLDFAGKLLSGFSSR